jgi:large subunit ribosomal protein L29
MKAKEYKEKIRKMSVEELRAEEQELKAQLFRLRFKGATTPIDNPVQVRYIKRDIARVRTVIKEKQLQAANEQ